MPLLLPPPIESPRLLLRIVQETDLPDLMAVNGDDTVTRFLPYASWQTLADAEAWLKRMTTAQETGASLQFVIVEKATQRVIGTCLLFRYDEGSKRAEVGYVLGRAHWRRGLMFEALTALLRYAFGEVGIRRLEAEVHPDNQGSNGVLQKCGFVREGLLRKRWTGKGETYDTYIYGLLADEWIPPSGNIK